MEEEEKYKRGKERGETHVGCGTYQLLAVDGLNHFRCQCVPFPDILLTLTWQGRRGERRLDGMSRCIRKALYETTLSMCDQRSVVLVLQGNLIIVAYLSLL
jgi:hypothetical protein